MRRRFLLVLAGFLGSLSLPAQQRGTVTATIRNERGDSVPFARVRTVAGRADSTTANVRGVAVLTLPYGRARLMISALGYEPLERDIEIDRATVRAEIVVRRSAQQLNQVNVRAAWVGIRGGIGDQASRESLRGAVISVARPKLQVVSDSLGRFEIPLPDPGPVVLRLEKPGYVSKPVSVMVLPDQPTDVVFFMNPGNDPRGAKLRLDELARRLAATQLYAFTADYEQLSKTKSKSLYDALVSSGLLIKNHLKMGKSICLFVDGIARPGFPVSTIDVEDVQFVEVYSGEVTQTLSTEWPRGQPCTSHENFFPTSGLGPFVGIVSVWMRK